MWHESERQIVSYYAKEVKRNLENRNSQISEDQFKRLQVMEKVYDHK